MRDTLEIIDSIDSIDMIEDPRAAIRRGSRCFGHLTTCAIVVSADATERYLDRA